MLRFAIFALRNGFVSSANEYWFGVESWFVVGCFIADLSMVVSLLMNISSQVNVFVDWVRKGVEFDLIEWGDGLGLTEGVLTRARICALVLGVLFFLLSQVSQRMGLKILHHPKNDASFYRKWRVVLWKVTCRFIENNVSFCGKWRVVLDWRSKSSFEDGVLGSFWGGVAVWKCDIEGCCFWNRFKWLLHNGL